jgi:hypothetical protein
MNRIQKQAVTALLILTLLLALGGQSLASGPSINEPCFGIISPLWVNIDGLNATLTFNGSQASCSGRAFGKAGTTMITGTAVLARLNSNGTYTAVKTWSGLVSYSDMLVFSGTYYVTTGYTYRLAFTVTVYKNGSSETATAYSSAYAG